MESIIWQQDTLKLLDQRKLPLIEEYIQYRTVSEVAEAIEEMVVRGAPAIGATAAYGMVLAAKEAEISNPQDLHAYMKKAAERLAATRPTAVNLFWALERIMNKVEEIVNESDLTLFEEIEKEAIRIAKEDIAANKKIGEYGAGLVEKDFKILTYCNAGALATVGYGTALGVIRRANEEGKNISVYACETRPYLQGARLTAWEMVQEKIPVTLITDNVAGFLMQKGEIDMVVVGADRVAANGDVANKIGTYTLAVLAKENDIPFYVAAPVSTFDISIDSGENIPIEERDAKEVTHFAGQRIAPEKVSVYNPAFDITPAKYITALITEVGLIKRPSKEAIKKIFVGAI